MTSIAPSDCENPKYPNWIWRYNRDKHLSRFQPWFTRVERWWPHYRNMGVGDHFQFHVAEAPDENGVMWRGGLSYAQHLNEAREPGSGHSALGHVAGPAPPRYIRPEVVPHKIGELLKLNCVENVSEGASLHDGVTVPKQIFRKFEEPLNPRQYLEKTLGQPVEYPGTFPHINGSAPKTDVGSVICCGGAASGERKDPLVYWLEFNRRREEANRIHRSVLPHPYPEYCCEFEWEIEKPKCLHV